MVPQVLIDDRQRFWQNKPLLITIALLALIALYFWTQSRYPALNEKAIMAGDTRLAALGFDILFEITPDQPLALQILYNTANWIYTNVKGMTFGILFAAMLMTLMTFIDTRRSNNRFVNSALGIAVGAPLGVCVNCVTPIAKGFYSAGAKVETTLSTMFSSPTLNVIVLAMIFSIFPTYMAAIKVGMTLLFILIVVPILTRVLPFGETVALDERQAALANRNAREITLTVPPPVGDSIHKWPNALAWVGRSYFANLWFIIKTTVPLMILAGFLGSAFVTLVPLDGLAQMIPNDKSIRIVLLYSVLLGAIGLFLPVPMAFDVILVAVLLQLGMPIKYAMVLLFTLGIFSIYPFFIIWQSISKIGAVALFGALLALGVASGWGAEKLRERNINAQEAFFIAELSTEMANTQGPLTTPGDLARQGRPLADLLSTLQAAALRAMPFLAESDGVSVDALPFQEQRIPAGSSGTLFTRLQGAEFGFEPYEAFSLNKLILPFSVTRGIATGDVHNDGWTDVVVTSETGLALYANDGGRGLIQQQIDIPTLSEHYVLNAALVDLDDDGWLDLYFSTYRNGNYVVYNQEGQFLAAKLQALPNQPAAFATVGPGFGDIDRDGDLDVMLGNWSGGPYNRDSLPSSADVLLMNDNGSFDMRLLPGVPGQTLSTLFSDFNNDGFLDLLVGNDFRPADVIYLGDGQGGLTEVTTADGLIPHTTNSSMSYHTADLNNDLVPETYSGQVSRAGRAQALPPEQLCSEITDTAVRARCVEDLTHRDQVQDAKELRDTRLCMLLDTATDREACVMTALLAFATYLERDQASCDLIPASWDNWKFLCNQSFEELVSISKEQEELSLPSITSYNTLWVMNEDGSFSDKAEEMGVEIGGWTWNAKFADVDNDEWQDLYVANGYMIGDVALTKQESVYFYHNQGGEGFADATAEVGLTSYLDYSAYSYVDLDNDGDLDIVAVPMIGPISTYINNADNQSIAFELRDGIGNHFGIGSKIIIHYGPDGSRHQMRELQAGGGFQSFDAPIATFGLGEYDQVQKVEVIWSTGERTVLEAPFEAGTRYVITRK